MTASQTVARNVRRLRNALGWTQTEAAGHLAEMGGPRWSKANWSALERTADGNRMRNFSAEDLVWLSNLFSVSIGDLFEESRIPCPHCHGSGEVADSTSDVAPDTHPGQTEIPSP